MLRHLEVLFDCQWVWSCFVFNLKRFSEHLFKVLLAQGFHSRPCQHGRVDKMLALLQDVFYMEAGG